MNATRVRNYREVAVSAAEGGYAVLLDGEAARTPAGAQLLLPTSALAEAVAQEWRAQTDKIRPETMILTKLANTTIDRVAPDRRIAMEQILAFSRSDLICYRGEGQTSLVDRQARAWDPLLQWADAAHGVKLKTGSGIAFIEQSAAAIGALEGAIAARDDFMLAGLHAAAALCGSAIIALALAEGRLDAAGAFDAAHVDEIYQWERWGKDHEAAAKADKERRELFEITAFFQFLEAGTAPSLGRKHQQQG